MTRSVPASATRGVRRDPGRPRSAARRAPTEAVIRSPLARVRPLRLIPRGVVPYVKH